MGKRKGSVQSESLKGTTTSNRMELRWAATTAGSSMSSRYSIPSSLSGRWRCRRDTAGEAATRSDARTGRPTQSWEVAEVVASRSTTPWSLRLRWTKRSRITQLRRRVREGESFLPVREGFLRLRKVSSMQHATPSGGVEFDGVSSDRARTEIACSRVATAR